MSDRTHGRRLHVGLDFDDTLMPTREALVALLNKIHGTEVRVEDCDDYYLSHPWAISEDQFHLMFNENEAHIHTQPPLEGMLETLRAWSDHATFSVVTGRPQEWLASATSWMVRHGIEVKQIIAAKDAGGKGAVARKLGLDFFIEDHADFAKEVADAGVPVLLLDRPYNQSLRHDKITRVKDWHEIRNIASTVFDLRAEDAGNSRSLTSP